MRLKGKDGRRDPNPNSVLTIISSAVYRSAPSGFHRTSARNALPQRHGQHSMCHIQGSNTTSSHSSPRLLSTNCTVKSFRVAETRR